MRNLQSLDILRLVFEEIVVAKRAINNAKAQWIVKPINKVLTHGLIIPLF